MSSNETKGKSDVVFLDGVWYTVQCRNCAERQEGCISYPPDCDFIPADQKAAYSFMEEVPGNRLCDLCGFDYDNVVVVTPEHWEELEAKNINICSSCIGALKSCVNKGSTLIEKADKNG